MTLGPEVYLVSAAVAVATGAFATLLGIGGGLVIVPLLSAFGVESIQAIAVSSFAIVLGSSLATYRSYHLERAPDADPSTMGRIQWSAAFAMAGPMVAVSYAGAELAARLPERILLHLFTAMVLVALGMLEYNRQVVLRHARDTYEPMPRDRAALVRLAFAGGAGGVITGLFGLGGGMIMVPLQVLLFKAHLKTAIKNSQAVIAAGAMAATLGHYQNGHVPVQLASVVGIGMMAGAHWGAGHLRASNTDHLRLAFNGLLVLSLVRSLLVG